MAAKGSGGDAGSTRRTLRDLAIVVLARVCASLVVLATGFRVVSDDDYARVVIAEQWAHAPRLDPTGTSWLPLPFWLTGSVLLVFGRGLDVARAVAFVTGALSSAVIYFAARCLIADRRGAVAGAALASIFPWSARLGVATVPELPAAALALFAMASTAPGLPPRRRLWGGIALFASTLMRYEAWLVAAGFALLCVHDAARSPANSRRPMRDGAGAVGTLSTGAARAPKGAARAPSRELLLAAGLALLGPVLWVLWNHHAHGDALDFLARVTAYRRAALGEGGPGTLETLIAYPIAMMRHEPELAVLLVVVAVAARVWAPTSLDARRWMRPAALAVLLVAGLSIASVRDGAPTHHPERAVLVVLLLAAVFAGGVGYSLGRRASVRARAGLGAAAVLVGGLGAAWMRPSAGIGGFVQRQDEVAIGCAAGQSLRPGERVLVEVVDYGYFALMAAMGRPEDAVADRDLDPRLPQRPSSFEVPEALAHRAAEVRAIAFAGRLTPVTRALGDPAVVSGSWGLWAQGVAARTAGSGVPLIPDPSSGHDLER